MSFWETTKGKLVVIVAGVVVTATLLVGAFYALVAWQYNSDVKNPVNPNISVEPEKQQKVDEDKDGEQENLSNVANGKDITGSNEGDNTGNDNDNEGTAMVSQEMTRESALEFTESLLQKISEDSSEDVASKLANVEVNGASGVPDVLRENMLEDSDGITSSAAQAVLGFTLILGENGDKEINSVDRGAEMVTLYPERNTAYVPLKAFDEEGGASNAISFMLIYDDQSWKIEPFMISQQLKLISDVQVAVQDAK